LQRWTEQVKKGENHTSKRAANRPKKELSPFTHCFLRVKAEVGFLLPLQRNTVHSKIQELSSPSSSVEWFE